MRLFILTIFASALLMAGVGAAQVSSARVIRPGVIIAPTEVQPLQQQQAPGELNYQDPEAMKAALAKLKKEKRELRSQLATTLADLQNARMTLDEMTRKGGSLVTAQCASRHLSRNTAGAEENCAASGYACEDVSGLCKRMCNVTTDCAHGFVCDTAVSRCIVPPTGD